MSRAARSLTGIFLLLLCCLSSLPFAYATPKNAGNEATLVINNRPIVTFRAELLGASPAFRADRAQLVIRTALQDSENLKTKLKHTPEGIVVLIGNRVAFVVTPGDGEQLGEQNVEDVAEQAARRLDQVISETHEARNLEYMAQAFGWVVAATLVLLALLWALRCGRERLAKVLLALAERKTATLKVAGAQLIDAAILFRFLRQSVMAGGWLLGILLIYEWASFVLLRFPYTRYWGERLNAYLIDLVSEVFALMLGAIPGLGVAILIFLMARLISGLLGKLITRLSLLEPGHAWLRSETVVTTRRLASLAIWIFAFAMAYPYLPGAQTDAFKGLSVLLGLMLSLGATSIVGQGTAGLVLTYTGALRVGEYVRISEFEGTVVSIGVFTTRIRTGLGEELSLPNSLITNSVTKNYSRTVNGPGYVVDTTVTIGYDTPWRQVEAMLIEAASRTSGILSTPPPRVFQTALSDFYPEYRLVAQAVPSEPRSRAEVLSALHANIQDIFNTHGVQIMSPHYMADPNDAKLVKPADWHRAPANPSDQS